MYIETFIIIFTGKYKRLPKFFFFNDFDILLTLLLFEIHIDYEK